MDYQETNREDFNADNIQNEDVPVAQVEDEEANVLIPADAVADEKEENYLKIDFAKPYNFEGDIFRGVNLSGLEDINGHQLKTIEKAFGKLGIVSTMPETTAAFAMIAATVATGLPAEFFEGLPGKEVRKIKTAVTRFFYDED